MSHHPTAEHPPPGWPPPYPPGQHPRPGTRRPRWVVPVATLVVVLLAGVITVVLATREQPSGGSADTGPAATRSDAGASPDGGAVPEIPVDVPGWREGQPITEEILRAVKPEDLFWIVYKRQSMIPIHEVVQETWMAQAGKPVAPRNLVVPQVRTVRIILDYRGKDIARAETSRTPTGDLSGAMICVEGKRFSKTETALEENRPYTESTVGGQDCPPTLTEAVLKRYPNLGLWVNDAFMTGGLSSVQADRFIDCMRERQLVSVSSVALVQASGQSYVAVEGQVNRVEARTISTETKQGHDLVRDCFDLGTELKQELHPYPFSVGGAQGLHWIYYLDPTNLRPAFSRRETTPVLSMDGSESPANAEYNASISWVRWAYPTAVPQLTLADGEQVLTVSWPAGLPGK